MSKSQPWIAGALLYVLLGATLLIYWPGLNGPIVLDDVPNLRPLARIGPVDDASSFLRFALSRSGSYPNRPLAYASFLINDRDWPLYVPAQKLTNVLIHLLNGALVFWLALLLCRAARLEPHKVGAIALSSTALWLLAPLQVSAVLYLIQRMTELSALFVLGGLIAYCRSRLKLNQRPNAALGSMTVSLGLFGILGFLCKESAVLLPLFILAMEFTLLRFWLPVTGPRTRARFQAWRWLVLIAPLVLVFAYIVFGLHVLNGYETRPFTAFERIITEPRILFSYLHDLLIPVRQGMSVAHDDYVISTGLLSPPRTLVAIVALVGLFLAAIWRSRKSASLFGFAVLWFLAGHLMESSFIPLELYFEHRNYLPSFGPLMAIAYYVWVSKRPLSKYLKPALGVYLAAFGFVTAQNVKVWSNKILMAYTWAADHPRSVRAQQLKADVLSGLGKGEEAYQVLVALAAARPKAMGPQVQVLLSACRAEPEHIDRTLREMTPRIANARFDYAVVPSLIMLGRSNRQKCPALSDRELLDLTDTILKQDSVSIRPKAVADLLYFEATILASNGKKQNAASHLLAAFRWRPSYNLGITTVEYFYNIGEYRVALTILDQVAAIPLETLSPDNFRDQEIAHWRERIGKKLDHSG